VAAGLATLQALAQPGFYERLGTLSARLASGLTERARAAGVPFCADAIGGMFGIYFRQDVPKTLAEVSSCDTEAFSRFFHAMLDEGVHFAPSAFEAGFVSAAHDEDVIDQTLQAAERAFAKLRQA